MTDTVNHPPHYKAGGIEAIDVIESFGLGFHLGNVVKYILRAGRKGYGDEDLRKARWYLDRRIAAGAPPDEEAKPLYYLASPYTKYKSGDIEASFIESARIAGALLKLGHDVYSPIVHMHPLSVHGRIDPLDHAIWLPANQAMMDRCDALLVAQMVGWSESRGVLHEIESYTNAGKPISYLSPLTLEFAAGPHRGTV